MPAVKKMELVRKVVDDQEKRRAEALAASEKRLSESESKLAELQTYRDGYVRDFAARAQAGIDSVIARDYQVFLGRLEEALRQQAQIVSRTRVQRDAEMKNWQGAAQRAEGVGQMIKRIQTEEERAGARREQLESDERSQRAWATQSDPYGH